MASEKISGMTPAGALAGADIIPIVQGGANKKLTGAQLATFVGSPPFSDATALVKGSADATKLLRFEVDGFTAATTRVLTPPNQDATIAGLEVIQTFTKEQAINNGTVTVDTPCLYLTQTVNDDGSNQFIQLRMDAANTTEDEQFWFIRCRYNSGGGGLIDRFSINAAGTIDMGGSLRLTSSSSSLSFLDSGGGSFIAGAATLINISSSAAVPKISFFGAAVQPKQVSGANLTNNVTVGGTNDTIADFSDLTVYANSAAAIRNDIYQLARKLKQINDGLRAYGLFT